MRSGLVKPCCRLVAAQSAGPSRGQGGAPDWTSDLDAGEDRRRSGRREGPGRSTELVSHAPIRASQVGRIRRTSGIRAGLPCRTGSSGGAGFHVRVGLGGGGGVGGADGISEAARLLERVGGFG